MMSINEWKIPILSKYINVLSTSLKIKDRALSCYNMKNYQLIFRFMIKKKNSDITSLFDNSSTRSSNFDNDLNNINE